MSFNETAETKELPVDAVLYFSRQELVAIFELLSVILNRLHFTEVEQNDNYRRIVNMLTGKTVQGRLAESVNKFMTYLDDVMAIMSKLPSRRENLENRLREEMKATYDQDALEKAEDERDSYREQLEKARLHPKISFAEIRRLERERALVQENISNLNDVRSEIQDEMEELDRSSAEYATHKNDLYRVKNDLEIQRKHRSDIDRELKEAKQESSVNLDDLTEKVDYYNRIIAHNEEGRENFELRMQDELEKFDDDIDRAIDADFRALVISLGELLRLRDGMVERLLTIAGLQPGLGEEPKIKRMKKVYESGRVSFSILAMKYLDSEYPCLARLSREQTLAGRVSVARDVAKNDENMLKIAPLIDIRHATREEWMESQTKIKAILAQTMKNIDRFSSGIFEVRTVFNFTNYDVLVDGVYSEVSLPRLGRFEFDLRASDSYVNAYTDYATKMRGLSWTMRRDMIEGLENVKAALAACSNHITYFARAYHVLLTNSAIHFYYRTVTASVMHDVIDITIQQLKDESPTLDNYTRSFGEVLTGSDPVPQWMVEKASDYEVICQFVNPFMLSPVYLIAGIAGVAHSAVDKFHYWLHIANTQCEDLDCIPCAVGFIRPFLVKVPDAEIKMIRANINSLGLDYLTTQATTGSLYNKILSCISVPWIIVNHITEMGDWDILAASDINLLSITPDQWNLKKDTILCLYLRNNHMTRVLELCHYDECAWEYSKQDFLILGSVKVTTGIGRPIMKLLKGHRALFEAGSYCIGDETYDYLLNNAKDYTSDSCLILLDSLMIIPALVKDTITLHCNLIDEECDAEVKVGPGHIRNMHFKSGVPVLALDRDECIKMAFAEHWLRLSSPDVEIYEIWDMLHLPRWMIVKDLTNDPAGWTVVAASNKWLYAYTPYDAVKVMADVVVFLQCGESGRSLKRVIEYLLDMPLEDGTKNVSSARYCFDVCCNSDGLVHTLDSFGLEIPDKNGDYIPLISDEEMDKADKSLNESNDPAAFVRCFDTARCVVIKSVTMTKGGRLKSFDVVTSKSSPKRKVTLLDGSKVTYGGSVSANDIYDGAEDLLRFFQDPDGKLWYIVTRHFYNMDSIMKNLIADLPVEIMAIDYESINRGHDTWPIVLGYALTNKGKIETGVFTGIDCDRKLITFIEVTLNERKCSLIVVSFYGSVFDYLFTIAGLAQYGELGKRSSDKIVLNHNKVLMIKWGYRVKYIDIYRFTQGSLASVCRDLKVANPKSKINLSLIQKTYDNSDHNYNTFVSRLSQMKYSDLVQGIDKDSQDAGFVAKVTGMNGYEVFKEYCINDARATLQCWLKLREACNTLLDYSDLSAEDKETLRPGYDINKYCTAPSMAYHLYKKALPPKYNDKGKAIGVMEPPIALSYAIHKLIVKHFIGGRSEIYRFFTRLLLIEPHIILDAISLYPGSALAGHMPAGDIVLVANPKVLELLEHYKLDLGIFPEELRKDFRLVDNLPVADKLGGYTCIITKHPDGPHVIPYRDEHNTLNWEKPAPHIASVPVHFLRMHLHYGGEAVILFGFFFTEMCDIYFHKSVNVWRCVKLRQDELITEANEEIKKLTAAGLLTAEKRAEIESRYSLIIRFLVKFLSVSILGAAAKRIRTEIHKLVFGNDALTKYEKDHEGKHYCVHNLARQGDKKSITEQMNDPYRLGSLITEELDPNELFDKKKRKKSDISPAALVLSMFGYAASHMYPNLRNMWFARSIRGDETDGLHGNQRLYEQYCVKQGCDNPYWLDGPLAAVTRGDPLDDMIFKDTGETVLPTTRIGSMRCPSRALSWAMKHPKLDGSPNPTLKLIDKPDYLYFKDEIESDELFRLAYPFKKFYYFGPVDPVSRFIPQIRSKGVGRSTKLGESIIKAQLHQTFRFMNAHNAIKPYKKQTYAAMIAKMKPLSGNKLRRDIQLHKDMKKNIVRPGELEAKEEMNIIFDAYNKAENALCYDMFEKICTGYAVDVVDYRFQGGFCKLSANTIHYVEVTSTGVVRRAPIYYSFAVKRIEPHKSFKAKIEGGEIKNEYVTLNDADVTEIEHRVLRMTHPCDTEDFWVNRMYEQRGFTYTDSVLGKNIYFSNKAIQLILKLILKYGTVRKQGTESSRSNGITSLSTIDSLGGGNETIQVGNTTLRDDNGSTRVLSKK